jgi:hypothetical protein
MGEKGGSGGGCASGCAGAALAVVFVGFWSAGTLFFDGILVYGVYRQLAAEGYPSTVGTITHSQVKESSGEDGCSYSIDVKYTYRVEGREYECSRYRYGEVSSGGGNARRVVDSLPVGKQIEVYYNPADPADAVLLTGVEGSDLFLAMFATPFNLVMLGGWGILGYGAYLLVVRPEGPRVRPRRRGFRQYLQVSGPPPLLAAAATLMAASFASVFIVGFGVGGFHPPISVMVADWALVLGATLAVYVWRRLPGGAGRREVVVDEVSRALTLPPAERGGQPVVVPLSAVEGVEVEHVARTDSDGCHHEDHFPTVVYRAHDGSLCRHRLGKQSEGGRAEAIARWLREQVGITP